MTKNSESKNPWSAYLLRCGDLGFDFQYPSQYIDCLEFDARDVESGGDGHGLSFLTREEALSNLAHFASKASNRPLVPFARGDNGDGLYCFDGQGLEEIYVINLGETPLQARRTGQSGLVAFVNAYRANLDMAAWVPGGIQGGRKPA